MRDPRLDKLAAVIVKYSTRIKHGDLVTIVGDHTPMPAIEALYEAVLRAGGHPSFHSRADNFTEILLRHGSDHQLDHVCPFERYRLEACDVLIVLDFHNNSRFLGRMDPARTARMQAARKPLITQSVARGAAGKLRYCAVAIPSNAAAQDAGMSLTDYEDWVFRAGFLDHADPVGVWRQLSAQQETACRYLAGKSTLRFRAPSSDGAGGALKHDGTDLTVDVSGRTWINAAGDQNFPDGEVYTGPRAVDGVVNFEWPSIYKGVEVAGIRLKFRAGRIVEASAARNEPYLISLLDQDEGARNAGEIAIGTNYNITACSNNTFFDEKIGGTFHIAAGAGFPETGHTNVSALHWDLVCDLRRGGTIHADDALILKDGRFTLPAWPGN